MSAPLNWAARSAKIKPTRSRPSNLTEFACSGLGLNPHLGTPPNPQAVGEPRVPGGSSSGSAVALAPGQ